MKTANEIQLEALAKAYDDLRLYQEAIEEDAPERKWVGLTWAEILSIIEHFPTPGYSPQLCRAIEAKLKELNT